MTKPSELAEEIDNAIIEAESKIGTRLLTPEERIALIDQKLSRVREAMAILSDLSMNLIRKDYDNYLKVRQSIKIEQETDDE